VSVTLRWDVSPIQTTAAESLDTVVGITDVVGMVDGPPGNVVVLVGTVVAGGREVVGVRDVDVANADVVGSSGGAEVESTPVVGAAVDVTASKVVVAIAGGGTSMMADVSGGIESSWRAHPAPTVRPMIAANVRASDRSAWGRREVPVARWERGFAFVAITGSLRRVAPRPGSRRRPAGC
jgi:hypothetical protein